MDMVVPEFDLGDMIRIDGVFMNLAGVLTDPDTLQFAYLDPNGAYTDIPDGDVRIVADSVGKFHVSIPGTIPGVWDYKWVPGGNIAGVQPGAFFIKYPRI